MARRSLKGIPRRLTGPRPRGRRGQFISRSAAKGQITRIRNRQKAAQVQKRQKAEETIRPGLPLREFLIVFTYRGQPRNFRNYDLFVNARTRDEALDIAQGEEGDDTARRVPWTHTTIIDYGPPTGPEGTISDER